MIRVDVAEGMNSGIMPPSFCPGSKTWVQHVLRVRCGKVQYRYFG